MKSAKRDNVGLCVKKVISDQTTMALNAVKITHNVRKTQFRAKQFQYHSKFENKFNFNLNKKNI